MHEAILEPIPVDGKDDKDLSKGAQSLRDLSNGPLSGLVSIECKSTLNAVRDLVASIVRRHETNIDLSIAPDI